MAGLFSWRRKAASAEEQPAAGGGDVLDRLAVRLQRPICGDLRLDLARELDVALPRVANCESRTAIVMTAHREAQRIMSTLRIDAPPLCDAVAEELAHVVMR